MVFLKASNYSDLLGRLTQTMLGPDDLAECKRLESEYYILRTAMVSISIMKMVTFADNWGV